MDLTSFNQQIGAPWASGSHRSIAFTSQTFDVLPSPVCNILAAGLGNDGADAAERLIKAAPQLLGLANDAVERVNDLHKAFGAPGDFGYDTPQGKALFAIYQIQRKLAIAVKAIALPPTSQEIKS
jgi:hypothetical protein